MKRISLKDIAGEVGVSKTAVSKVLNNLPMRISPDKKRKIIDTAKKLHYRPNILARGLQNKSTKSIGLVVPNMNTLFYPELIRSIATKLFSHGYQTIICDTEDNVSRERLHIEDLLSRLVDGLVVAPAAGNKNIGFFRYIHKSKHPFIMIDRYFPGEEFRYVITDNKEGARKGVRRLVRNGVREIIYIGEKVRHQSLSDRLSGVKEETRNRNIRFTGKNIFFCDPERKDIKKTCNLIFEKELHETGIFLESNRLLMGLLDAAKEKGLLIPDDFKIIGFDVVTPELTSAEDFKSIEALKKPGFVIKQDIIRMGKKVSEYLISSFTRNSRRKWQIKLLPEIIVS